ncbi:MAG: signal peptidase I [Planctomycetota bacterium]|jgi:signal peptidase I
MSRKKKKKKTPSLPAPSRGPTEDSPPSSRAKWIAVREHLEAVAGVVIVILVLRHFVLGNYQIPTSSMEPTLFGDHPQESIKGDRILVDRLAYKTGKPQRWDTVVFKYPLDRSKTYIKRLIGLPGEEIRIRRGNIYVNREPDGFPAKWVLARKPDHIQREVWQEIFPECRDEAPGIWAASRGSAFSGKAPEGTLKAKGEGEGWLEFRGKVQARIPGPGAPHNGDPMMEASLSFHGELDRGALLVEMGQPPWVFTFRIEAGGDAAEITLDGESVARSPSPLARDRRTALSFENVDGVITLKAGGKSILTHSYDPAAREGAPDHQRLRIGVKDGGSLSLSALRLSRDIHYVEDSRGILRRDGPLRVSGDSFFVLGDNCTRSKDSRLWRSVTYRLTDGGEVTGEFGGDGFVKDDAAGEIRIMDIHGNDWHLTRSQVKNFNDPGVYSPFVPRECLVGRAFMVYWPLTRLRLVP